MVRLLPGPNTLYRDKAGCPRQIKGWRIQDHDWCPRTGIWPLKPEQLYPEEELESYVGDMEGWGNREDFVFRAFESSQRSCGHGWNDEPMHRLWLYAPTTTFQKDCVRYWQTGGFDPCVCDDRPAIPPGQILHIEDHIIGNPGLAHDLNKGKDT